MRLYLSSHRMGDSLPELLAMAGAGVRAAVISNAVDFIPPEQRLAYARHVHDPVADFTAQGVEAADLDLRAYFGRPAELEQALAGIGLVWAVGGNAFLLLRAIRQSGLDGILARRLAQDSLVYGGWSAGACVAGATLEGLQLMDAPDVAPEGYGPLADRAALALVDFAIVPHFASDHPEARAAGQATAYMTQHAIPHRTLRDGEVIIVDGGPPQLRPARS